MEGYLKIAGFPEDDKTEKEVLTVVQLLEDSEK